jgi:heterodisulfide reductase subunit C
MEGVMPEEQRSSPIDVSELDPNFKHEIAKEPGGENIKACFACGTCSASCPVREIDERYNPRKIIRMAILGMRDRVLQSDFIWLCSTCYTCEERCPQNVCVTEVINAIKNIAAKEGYIHPAFKTQAELVGGSGRLYEMEDFDNKRRDKMGLPSLKTSFDEVRTLAESVGLKNLIEKKEKTE